jgi:hypothetical protein
LVVVSFGLSQWAGRRSSESRSLVSLIESASFCPAAAVIHVTPAPPLPAALIEKKPAAVAAVAYPDARSLGRAKQRERFGSEDPAQLLGHMGRGWTPAAHVVAKLDLRAKRIGSLANEVNITLR